MVRSRIHVRGVYSKLPRLVLTLIDLSSVLILIIADQLSSDSMCLSHKYMHM